jgi:hypothetical protein
LFGGVVEPGPRDTQARRNLRGLEQVNSRRSIAVHVGLLTLKALMRPTTFSWRCFTGWRQSRRQLRGLLFAYWGSGRGPAPVELAADRSGGWLLRAICPRLPFARSPLLRHLRSRDQLPRVHANGIGEDQQRGNRRDLRTSLKSADLCPPRVARRERSLTDPAASPVSVAGNSRSAVPARPTRYAGDGYAGDEQRDIRGPVYAGSRAARTCYCRAICACTHVDQAGVRAGVLPVVPERGGRGSFRMRRRCICLPRYRLI